MAQKEVTFNSLYEIHGKNPGLNSGQKSAFNSLYEILYYRRIAILQTPPPFNSLYEIHFQMAYNNKKKLATIFQFSL